MHSLVFRGTIWKVKQVFTGIKNYSNSPKRQEFTGMNATSCSTVTVLISQVTLFSLLSAVISTQCYGGEFLDESGECGEYNPSIFDVGTIPTTFSTFLNLFLRTQIITPTWGKTITTHLLITNLLSLKASSKL